MKIHISDTNACKALFFSISFFVGLWAVRIPDIKDQIEVDYTGMGYLFVIFSIGSVLTMIVAPKITQLYFVQKNIPYVWIYYKCFMAFNTICTII